VVGEPLHTYQPGGAVHGTLRFPYGKQGLIFLQFSPAGQDAFHQAAERCQHGDRPRLAVLGYTQKDRAMVKVNIAPSQVA
jgi:hypothetical protein